MFFKTETLKMGVKLVNIKTKIIFYIPAIRVFRDLGDVGMVSSLQQIRVSLDIYCNIQKEIIGP